MHQYDNALRVALQDLGSAVLRGLAGKNIERWLDMELPKTESRRVDLLGQTPDGKLVHFELQSANDPEMPVRMAEYALAVYKKHDQFPEQIVFYVGRPPMRMNNRLQDEKLSFEFRIVDARDLDGEELLASELLGDNVIAILGRLRDHRAAVRHVYQRIASADPGIRERALAAFMILAGLRQLSGLIEEEAGQMIDMKELVENSWPYMLGMKQGMEKGVETGKAEGIQQGEVTLALRLIRKRFGDPPEWVEARLRSMTITQLEELSLRILDVHTLDEMFA